MILSGKCVSIKVPSIEYVGGTTYGGIGSTSNAIVSLTSLTGGIASSPQSGDICIVINGCESYQDTSYANPVVGFTTLSGEDISGDSHPAHSRISYKILNGTETSISVGGTMNTTRGLCVAVMVFRNVNQTTPFSTAIQFATGINSRFANPPASTSTGANQVVVFAGLAGTAGSNTFTYSGDCDAFITAVGTDTANASCGLGFKTLASAGTFDAVAFSTVDSTTTGWNAYSIVLNTA